MKFESLKMNLKSLKSQVNNQKGCLFNEKVAKSANTFRKNKPNSPIVQTDVTSLITMNYAIFTSLTKVKNKPNQTQFKPKTNPIFGMAKFALSSFMTSKYEKVSSRRVKKTNPIFTTDACPRFVLTCFSVGCNTQYERKFDSQVRICYTLPIMSSDLKDKTLGELEQIIAGLGRKEKYLAGYIFHFIHAKDAAEILEITPLSKALREKLIAQGFYISQLEVINKLTAKDGTVKYVFAMEDGSRIETVLLLDGRRKTLCVSTQAGCKMGCVFCATGKVKFRRNLTAGEIVDQVYIVQKDAAKISNLVYMGMGEPLENYDAVVKSVKILNDPAGPNIGVRHITISTCGVAPAIKKLTYEHLHPRLAISLNAATDDLRNRIMPINKRYPLTKLLGAVKKYQLKLKDRVTFEYVMIKGINDSLLHARQLVNLLRGIKCNVNLIEYNPHAGCKYKGSGRQQMSRFAEVIEEAGIENTIRLKKGSSICAACGQLGANLDNISSTGT